MLRLKLILQSNIFYGITILILVGYIFYCFSKPDPVIEEGNRKITGTIEKITMEEGKATYQIQSKEKLLVTLYEPEEDFELGDVVEVEGIVKRPSKNRNFYLFSYRNYLKSLRIYETMIAQKITLIEKNTSLFFYVKNQFIHYLEMFPKQEYYFAFLLGDTSQIEPTTMESYRKNGISHVFAVSGMHVGILSGAFLMFFKKFRIDKLKSYGILIPILLFYAWLTGLTPSVVRAVSLFVLLFVNDYWKLQIRTIHLFLISCIVVLWNHPFLLYHTGFLFSYVISFFLITFRSTINRCKGYFQKLCLISMISFLASFPIQCNTYFQVNFFSPILNLFFVPAVSTLLFPLVLLTVFLPFLAPLVSVGVTILEHVSLWCVHWASFPLAFSHLSFPLFLLLYILIYFVLKKCFQGQFVYFALFAVVLFCYYHSAFWRQSYAVHFLDVGQGDSALLTFPHKDWGVLIDTGGVFAYGEKEADSIAMRTLIPYMQAIGLKKVKYLVLSHGDSDHMGEAIDLVENFKVEKVIFNCGPYNDLEQELIKVLDKKKIKYYSCIKELNIDNNKLYFLQTKEYDNENDNSNVIYTELNGYKFLFMGDAEIEKEKDILEKYNISNIDVLKVGHHGSKTSSDKNFINEINPKYSIISVGKNNRYGHPNKEVLNNLNNSKIYRTDQDGSIMFKIKNNKLKIKTCSP